MYCPTAVIQTHIPRYRTLARPTPVGSLLLLGALATLILVAGQLALNALAGPPSEAEAERIVYGHDLVAYERWDDASFVVFRDRGQVFYDRLSRDTIAIDWPPLPRWQLTGRWYQMPQTTEAASVGVVACLESCAQPTVLFGELRDPRIVALEVSYDGAWHRIEVAGAGYLVRLDSTAVPEAYRWLDAAGATIYHLEAVAPLVY